jgi:hypothetical protein
VPDIRVRTVERKWNGEGRQGKATLMCGVRISIFRCLSVWESVNCGVIILSRAPDLRRAEGDGRCLGGDDRRKHSKVEDGLLSEARYIVTPGI